MRVYLKNLLPNLKSIQIKIDLGPLTHNGTKAIRLSKLTKLCDLSEEIATIIERKLILLRAGQHGGEIRPRFPIWLDERLGRIAGHILGDGSIDKKYRQVSFFNSNPELLEEFIKDMQFIFGVKPRIWQHKKSNFAKTEWDKRLSDISEKQPGRCVALFYPSACGIILNAILSDFVIGKKKSITSNMKNAPELFKRGLLRALFDDEGSCDAKSYMIRMYQDNKKLLEEMRAMLKEFNVHSNPIRFYYKRGKQRYYFSITKRSNFREFLQSIGFTSSIKQERLEKLSRPDQRCLVTPRLLQ